MHPVEGPQTIVDNIGDATRSETPAVCFHLTTRAQFQALLGNRPVAKTRHFALHRLQPAAGAARQHASLFKTPANVSVPAPSCCWIGAMTPKRWARRAVTRNLIRRQVYAVSRECGGVRGVAQLVRLRAAFSRDAFVSASSPALKRAVRLELQQLLRTPLS